MPFQWHILGQKFALPLALSPLLSMILVYAIAWPVGFIIARTAAKCVCVVQESTVTASADAAIGMSEFRLVVDRESNCETASAAVTTSTIANGIHWLSGGMVGFARGWNDAPKIAALGLIG